MQVGDIEVVAVFDGYGYEDAREVLLNPASPEADPWARHESQLDGEGRLKFVLGGFLVRTGDRVVRVDAGAGTINNGQYQGGQLLDSLRKHGVESPDVTSSVSV